MSGEMEVRNNGDEVEGELLPAVFAPDIQNERTDGWIRVLQPVMELAKAVEATEFVPAALRNNSPAVGAAILFGRELDMPPLQSLQQVHMIEGRPSLAAEHMRAMVLAAGHEITYDLNSPGQVTATGRRWYGGARGWSGPTSVTWSMAMAERAGLLGKKNWQRYPRRMLSARATSELCALVFADITHGIPSLEELEDGGLYDEGIADPTSPTPEPSGGKVSRRPRKGTQKPADGPAPTNPPVSADPVPSAPRPPLPGVGSPESAGDSTPGEGRASTSSTPADTAPELTLAFCELAGVDGAHEPHTHKSGRKTYRCDGYDVAPCFIAGDHGARLEDGTPAGHFWSAEHARHWCTGEGQEAAITLEPEQCEVSSHGHRCRYYAGHEGKHTYGGGMGDPVDARRCQIQKEHDSHAWNDRDGWHSCSGDLLEQDSDLMSEGDGSPDDVAATGTPEQYEQMKAAAAETVDAEVVDEAPEGIHPGQKRAVEAALGSLGVADRSERHHVASAILGRRITTFSPARFDAEGTLEGLTADDGSRLLNALAKVKDRDELEALIQRAAEEWNRDA